MPSWRPHANPSRYWKGFVGICEKRHGNRNRSSCFKAYDRLFMPIRVLFSPEFQEQRRHGLAHDKGSTYDGVAGGAQRDHKRQL